MVTIVLIAYYKMLKYWIAAVKASFEKSKAFGIFFLILSAPAALCPIICFIGAAILGTM